VVEQGKKTVQAYYTPVVMERLEKVYQEVIAEKSFKLW